MKEAKENGKRKWQRRLKVTSMARNCQIDEVNQLHLCQLCDRPFLGRLNCPHCRRRRRRHCCGQRHRRRRRRCCPRHRRPLE